MKGMDDYITLYPPPPVTYMYLIITNIMADHHQVMLFNKLLLDDSSPRK